MIRKWRVACAATAALAALALTACGGGGGDAAATGPAGEPVQGGSATVLALSEPRSMDPLIGSNNTPGNAVVGNGLFGTLLVTDPRTGEVVPSILSEFTTADQGATFRLTVRDGVRFSDGTPFEASAIKTYWERVKDPANGSAALGDAGFVQSIEVTSPRTATVTLATPFPTFGQAIVSTVLNWVPKPEAAAAGAAAFDANPIGAGPFTLQEWRRQDAIVLVRNPTYWDAPRPYLDRITVRPALDTAQRLNTVVSGGADLASDQSWSTLQKARQSGLHSEVQPLSGGNYLALNTRRAPFDDPRAREAVAAAFDPNAVNASVYSGAAQPVDTLFAAGSPFRADAVPAAIPPDRERAQRLFDELAAEGRPVRFAYTGTASTENKGTGEALQAQLSAFRNVSVELEVVDYGTVASLQATKDFDATISSAAFLDPEPRMTTTFGSTSRANMVGLQDPELDRALAAGRTATSVDERKAAYEVVQQRLTAAHAALWITRNASGVIAGKQVGGITVYGYGSLLPGELWIQN